MNKRCSLLILIFKDNWVGDEMPTNICQETKDYENCRSYRFMTACGFPYDYGSVMHYTAKRSESSK